jgi:hypothetical protein
MMYAPLFLCQQNEVLFRQIVNWGNQSKAELHSLSVEEQDLQESWKDAAKARRSQSFVEKFLMGPLNLSWFGGYTSFE